MPNKRYDAWLSKPAKNGFIQCLSCNHYCKIPKGKTGICGVRYNDEGRLKLLVYGRVAARNIDPVEKKPLFHFYPGSEIYSIGTMGCNFRCTFCQNWDISQFHKDHTVEEIETAGIALSPEDMMDYCLKNGIPGIAFTYNEPTIFCEFAYDTAKLAKEKGLHTVYVSNGFESKEALEKLFPYIDAMNIDLKSFYDEYYIKVCGGRVEPVKENIKDLWDKGMWIEVTTLVTTNHNDSEKEFREIAEFLKSVSRDIPWHISRYFPAYKMDDPPTPIKTLEKAYEIGREVGLNYVYVGNAIGMKKENTYCPECGELLIEREGYSIHDRTNKGKCQVCGYQLQGRF